MAWPGTMGRLGKRADRSFRLRLHSGLRQSGAGRRPGCVYGTAEAVPFRTMAWLGAVGAVGMGVGQAQWHEPTQAELGWGTRQNDGADVG